MFIILALDLSLFLDKKKKIVNIFLVLFKILQRINRIVIFQAKIYQK